MRPNGSDSPLEAANMMLGIWGLAILSLLLTLAAGFIATLLRIKNKNFPGPKTWPDLIFVAIVCLIFIFFMVIAFDVGARFKNAGLRRIAIQGEPLVEAIQRYQATNHVAPDALDNLVPAYIPNIPPTGAAAHPRFNFIKNQNSHLFAGNPWILTVPISANRFTTCEFLTYYPNQNYPKYGLGDADIPKFGNWALIELTTSDATNDGFATASDIGY